MKIGLGYITRPCFKVKEEKRGVKEEKEEEGQEWEKEEKQHHYSTVGSVF